MKNKVFYFCFFIALGLLSCKKKDNTSIGPNNNPPASYTNGLWIVNEGNFNYGNASLDFYYRGGKVIHDVFQLANKRPLGDVFQSMARTDHNYFLVVNNSQRIEVTDENMKSAGTIEGFSAPRYFLDLNTTKAYVTDMAANGIWIVNPSQMKITGKIDFKPSLNGSFPSWTEQMVLWGDKLFVCAVKAKQVLVINTKDDKLAGQIDVGIDPQWICKDANNKIWVMCNGSLQQKPSQLYRIDPVSEQLEKTFSFPATDHGPSALQTDPEGTKLYYLYNGLYEMSIDATDLPASPKIAENGQHFYGFGIDPKNGDFYLTDPKDYTQQGMIYQYSAGGAYKASFPSGIIPSSFCFVN